MLSKVHEKQWPKIFNTSIPNGLSNWLHCRTRLGVVSCPTGYGKTFGSIWVASFSATPFTLVMPYKTGVLSMTKYASEMIHNVKIGYAMRGNVNLSKNDNCRLMTVGYCLVNLMAKFKQNGIPKFEQVIMIDEAHDASWQTDLLFRFVLWMQKSGAPIKLLISSATLHIENFTKNFDEKDTAIFKVDDQVKVDRQFLDIPVQSINHGPNGKSPPKVHDNLFAKILETIKNVIRTSKSGDILIVMPGKDEIEKMIEILTGDQVFDDLRIYPLYSGLTQEDINISISPDPNGMRKIIVSTNIAENSITIDGLCFVIDSGLRKVLNVDQNGVTNLSLGFASQSNIIQATGRVGRQNHTQQDVAYIMMTKEEFDNLEKFPENEVERNQAYNQIMLLISNGLPLEILNNISKEKLDDNIQVLIKNDALTKTTNGNFEVTEVGKIMSQLSLSLRVGRFLADVLLSNLDMETKYFAIVVASWIENSSSVFYRPTKKPRETQENFNERKKIIEESQEAFFVGDCLTTFINVWISYKTTTFTKGFKHWCVENGLYDGTLSTINSSVKHIINSLASFGFKIPEPKYNKNLNILTNELKQSLKQVYSDWCFTSDEYSTSYSPVNQELNGIYVIDKFIKNGLSYGSKLVIALSLRQISHSLTLMSNIVELE